MAQKGRKSAAKLSTVSELPQHPDPLPGMTAEAADIWRKTVKSLPVDWFRPEVYPHLLQYCEHTAESAEITRQIEHYKGTAEDFDPRQYDLLLKMRDRENRAANNLARSLRITLQATIDKKKTKGTPQASEKALWEA